MGSNKFEYYVSDLGRTYTGVSACHAIAIYFVSEALVSNGNALEYDGRYLSYSKSFNLCNEYITIGVFFDTTISASAESIEVFILKDNPKTPDNEKERVHLRGAKRFNNFKENSSIYELIAIEIWLSIASYFIDIDNDNNVFLRRKNCKVLSEVYKNDFR